MKAGNEAERSTYRRCVEMQILFYLLMGKSSRVHEILGQRMRPFLLFNAVLLFTFRSEDTTYLPLSCEVAQKRRNIGSFGTLFLEEGDIPYCGHEFSKSGSLPNMWQSLVEFRSVSSEI